MADYAVGDIQGCYRELMDVLDQVAFNPDSDRLWVVGDMVNRGPDCCSVLKFLFNHRRAVHCVLGNHDLHLLAIHHGSRKPRRSDTFDEILQSRQRADWLDWLQQQPLCYHDSKLNYCLVHAGIAPQWTRQQALAYSAEVEAVLQSKDAPTYLNQMYGNEPALWDEKLNGYQRLRCITNYFTRMRLVSRNGSLQLNYKDSSEHIPDGYYPWFKHPERKAAGQRIIFGHWAALEGHVDNQYLFGLDTGCVWGGVLTLMELGSHDLYMAQSTSKARA